MYLHYNVAVRIILSLNHVQPFVIPWAIACQAPLSMQDYWSWLPFPFQGIFLTQGSNPHLLLGGGFFTTEQPGNYIEC